MRSGTRCRSCKEQEKYRSAMVSRRRQLSYGENFHSHDRTAPRFGGATFWRAIPPERWGCEHFSTSSFDSYDPERIIVCPKLNLRKRFLGDDVIKSAIVRGVIVGTLAMTRRKTASSSMSGPDPDDDDDEYARREAGRWLAVAAEDRRGRLPLDPPALGGSAYPCGQAAKKTVTRTPGGCRSICRGGGLPRPRAGKGALVVHPSMG